MSSIRTLKRSRTVTARCAGGNTGPRKRTCTSPNGTASNGTTPYGHDVLSSPGDSVQDAPPPSPRALQAYSRRDSTPVVISSNPSPSIAPNPEPDFRVAIDFGTTYTTIAFVKCRGPRDVIFTIDTFPEDRCPSQHGRQVPSETVYVLKQDASPSPTWDFEFDRRYQRLHGYEAQRYLEVPPRDDVVVAHVHRMKLLLDDSDVTKLEKHRIRVHLANLKSHGLIHSEGDVIKHLLSYYFQHTKEVLQRDHGYHALSRVELTFTVPVCWSTKANAAMSTYIESAMRETQFGVPNGETPDLFMVNEAEAGASWALDSLILNQTFKRLETFLLVDSGGGTTDAGVYQATETEPLRLKCEVNSPTGIMCGSSDVNVRMEARCMLDLCGETYLEDIDSNVSIRTLVQEDIMPKFENEHKRYFKYKNYKQVFRYRIRLLKHSASNHRLREGEYVLNYEDMWELFKPSFEMIRGIMDHQVRSAHAKAREIDSVVVIGGFGDSPALKDYLRRELNKINRELGCDIEPRFAHSNTAASGIAKGAIIRAQNKTLGPGRIPSQSIGLFRHLYWEEDSPYAHIRDQKAELDGDEWLIKRTIEWIIKWGNTPLEPVHRVSFESVHSFSPERKRWRCAEVLFMSESCRTDFYQRTHKKNKGRTREMGRVLFDLTHVREKCLREHNADPGSSTKSKKIEVKVLIEMVVIDRNLKFYVRWPASFDGNVLNARDSFTIVAAFEPGTA